MRLENWITITVDWKLNGKKTSLKGQMHSAVDAIGLNCGDAMRCLYPDESTVGRATTGVDLEGVRKGGRGGKGVKFLGI